MEVERKILLLTEALLREDEWDYGDNSKYSFPLCESEMNSWLHAPFALPKRRNWSYLILEGLLGLRACL
jgi:hypothetical protein